MTLGDARVHPPLPDPRAAQGLPPHPPLRPPRQRRPRRQPRPHARAARMPAPAAAKAEPLATEQPEQPCPCCGGRMRVIETFEPGCQSHHPPTPPSESTHHERRPASSQTPSASCSLVSDRLQCRSRHQAANTTLPPRSWLSRIAFGAATSSDTLIKNRDQRAWTPIFPYPADAAQIP